MTQQQERKDPVVGQDLGSLTYEVSEQTLENYYQGLGLDRVAIEARTPFDAPVAPSLLPTEADNAFSVRGGFVNQFGNLWMRQEWDLRKPLMPGDSYECTARVVDIYERRDRTVVQQEISVWGPDHELFAQSMHHQSYLLGQNEGEVQLRDPKTKEGARRFEAPRGEAIDAVDATITLEMCGSFFHGSANYHTDQKAAEGLGFSNVVVGGRMTISYVGELMERRFGRGFWEGGKLDVKFTNIVWPDDHITVRGVITEREAEGDATRAHVSAWMEKDDGTVVLVASASALE